MTEELEKKHLTRDKKDVITIAIEGLKALEVAKKKFQIVFKALKDEA